MRESDPINKLLTEANQLYQAQKFEQAKALYLQVLNTQANNHVALHMLGVLSAQAGQLDKAEYYLAEALACAPHHAVYHNHYANILTQLKREVEALQHYQLAIDCDAEYAESYNNMANIYYRKQDWATAIKYYQQALAKNKNYIDAYYNIGFCYLHNQQSEQARQAWEQVVSHGQDELVLGRVQNALANLAVSEERFEDARTHYRATLNLMPKNWEARRHYAFVCLKLNERELAIREFSILLNYQDEDAEAHYNLGVLLLETGKVDDASYHFQRCLELDPDNADAHNNMGMIALKEERLPAAIQHYQAAHRLHPDDQAIAYTLTALEKQEAPSAAPQDYVTRLYDYFADHYDQQLSELDYQAPSLLKDLLAELFKQQSATQVILDLGCGTGLSGVQLKPYSKLLVGVDLSDKMLAQAKARNIYDELVQSDFADFFTRLANGSSAKAEDPEMFDKTRTQNICNVQQQAFNLPRKYDLICALDSLLYIGDLSVLFKTISQHLTDNGYFMFTVEQSAVTEPYQLAQSGRYQHHENYLKQLAGDNALRVNTFREVVLREQRGEPVLGFLCMLAVS